MRETDERKVVDTMLSCHELTSRTHLIDPRTHIKDSSSFNESFLSFVWMIVCVDDSLKRNQLDEFVMCVRGHYTLYLQWKSFR